MRKCIRCAGILENNRFKYDDIDICLDCGEEMMESIDNGTWDEFCESLDVDNQEV